METLVEMLMQIHHILVVVLPTLVEAVVVLDKEVEVVLLQIHMVEEEMVNHSPHLPIHL
tara:strand:+ start:170 stop:346 length:177 start_codon:yes stop_codon:yes gene_type:complete